MRCVMISIIATNHEKTINGILTNASAGLYVIVENIITKIG